MSVRVGFTPPSFRRRAEATDQFGDSRLCLAYFFKQGKASSRCFAIGSVRIRAAHLDRLPEATRVNVTVVGVLRIHADVQPSLADAKLGVVRAFPFLRAEPGVKRVLQAHAAVRDPT